MQQLLTPEFLIRHTTSFFAAAIIGFVAFLIGYSLLRLIRVSPNWVTWILGGLIIAACAAFCISLLFPHTGTAGGHPGNFPQGAPPKGSQHFSGDRPGGFRGGDRGPGNILSAIWSGNSHLQSNLLGAVSFVIGVYAASQWLARQWFVQLKKRTTSFLIQQSRNFLIFIRKQHVFFGWIIVAAAFAHMAFYIPAFQEQPSEIITGFIAIGILALMTILGSWVWIETSWRKRKMPTVVKNIHTWLTIAFFAVLLLHV